MNRWLNWTPGPKIIGKAPEPEPSKPSKTHTEPAEANCDGFDGVGLGHFPIIRDDKAPIENEARPFPAPEAGSHESKIIEKRDAVGPTEPSVHRGVTQFGGDCLKWPSETRTESVLQ
jgi:hypothetical protein